MTNGPPPFESTTPPLVLCGTPDDEELELRRGTAPAAYNDDDLPVEKPMRSPLLSKDTTRVPQSGGRKGRLFTFVVDGQEFQIPKPFLAIHSPIWAARFEADPSLARVQLSGEADSFGKFIEFLQATEGPSSEVNGKNVMPLLNWGKEFGVDYISALCEEFLLSRPPEGIEPTELLEIAARHNMPLLYSRATEVVAQGMHWVDVPDEASRVPMSDVFNVGGIREDLLSAHISMGLMSNDGEMNRRNRFSDYTTLDESRQRARLLWKTRKRFVPPPPEPAELDWKSLQMCWPHHSLRSDDWTVVAHEAQPNFPMRARGIPRGRRQ